MIRLILSFAFVLFSSFASAANYSWYTRFDYYNGYGSSPSASCNDAVSKYNANHAPVSAVTVTSVEKVTETNFRCGWSQGGVFVTYMSADRSGDSCPTGSTYNSQTGSCDAPFNPCSEKSGQSTFMKKVYPSFESYTSVGEKANQGGCEVTISDWQCGTNAQGEFACVGSGSYTGEQSVDGPIEGCVSDCELPQPTTSDSSQDCTPPTTSGSTTTYTCVTSSSAEQFASSNCAYGEVNGTAGYHCTSPDYVPASDSQTRTDDVSETTNPDGSKTTTTTSTTQKTYCEAGACNTTTTTTTTTKGTDAAGNPTGETTTCTGDECKGPEDPKDGKMPGTVPGPSTAEAFPKINNGNEAPSYADTTEAFYDRISGAPIVAALGTIQVPAGGSCNIGSASLFGGSVSFDHFCDMAPQVLDGLRYLFLAIWAWAAIRLSFTA